MNEVCTLEVVYKRLLSKLNQEGFNLQKVKPINKIFHSKDLNIAYEKGISDSDKEWKKKIEEIYPDLDTKQDRHKFIEWKKELLGDAK